MPVARLPLCYTRHAHYKKREENAGINSIWLDISFLLREISFINVIGAQRWRNFKWHRISSATKYIFRASWYTSASSQSRLTGDSCLPIKPYKRYSGIVAVWKGRGVVRLISKLVIKRNGGFGMACWR